MKLLLLALTLTSAMTAAADTFAVNKTTDTWTEKYWEQYTVPIPNYNLGAASFTESYYEIVDLTKNTQMDIFLYTLAGKKKFLGPELLVFNRYSSVVPYPVQRMEFRNVLGKKILIEGGVSGGDNYGRIVELYGDLTSVKLPVSKVTVLVPLAFNGSSRSAEIQLGQFFSQLTGDGGTPGNRYDSEAGTISKVFSNSLSDLANGTAPIVRTVTVGTTVTTVETLAPGTPGYALYKVVQWLLANGYTGDLSL